jgi:hypothetical protein
MSFDTPFNKENLDTCLKELGKEFRKLNGTKTPAKIILIGGAAILVNYGFREMTYDIDAIILASSAMKEAINHTGDRLGLPAGLGLLYYFALKSIVTVGAFVWLCAAMFAVALCGVYHYLCTSGVNRFERL